MILCEGQMTLNWVRTDENGIICPAACAWIDPVRPVSLALITHGHADHARYGHEHVIATPQTLDIMAQRYGEKFARSTTALDYGQQMQVGDVTVTMAPAGHVLGSAQIILDYQGQRLIAAGDYKRKADPTCAPFEVHPCDVFITEATFGLPVFSHPDPQTEITKILEAREQFPSRCLLIGAYALGKAQRVIALLREAGYDRPVYLHGAMQKLCALYQKWGIDLGELRPVPARASKSEPAVLAGEVVLAPPSAFGTVWAHKLADPLIIFASGWMQVKQRAKQRGVELPLILSDHADWDDLLKTIEEIAPREVWVTHGREDALIHACAMRQITARALSVIGYDEDGEISDTHPQADASSAGPIS